MNQSQRLLRPVLWLIPCLLLIGHLLPWASHKTAPLTLSANDLGFFTNFTPGAGIFLNEWFYLPVWVAAVLLSVIGYRLLPLNRLLVTAFGLGVASLGLPRYEQLIKFIRTPGLALRQSEFKLQLLLTLLVMALMASAFLASLNQQRARQIFKMPLAWPVDWSVVGLVLAALLCLVPLAGYLSIKPYIAELYRDAVGIGIGWWLTALADLVLWAAVFATIRLARSTHRTTH